MVRLFPASMVTFFPSIFTSPFGADIFMPVKALISTLPNGLRMLMERFDDERFTSYIPLASFSTMPPFSGFDIIEFIVLSVSFACRALVSSSFFFACSQLFRLSRLFMSLPYSFSAFVTSFCSLLISSLSLLSLCHCLPMSAMFHTAARGGMRKLRNDFGLLSLNVIPWPFCEVMEREVYL